MRLANRFMRMYHVVDLNGDAKDKLQWAIAVNTAIDNFLKEEPSYHPTSCTKQWEAWIEEKSVPEDIEFLSDSDKDCIPSDSLVAERVGTLKSTFSRWLKNLLYSFGCPFTQFLRILLRQGRTLLSSSTLNTIIQL